MIMDKWHVVADGDLPDGNGIDQILACQRDGNISVVTGTTVCNNKRIFVAWMPLPEPYADKED